MSSRPKISRKWKVFLLACLIPTAAIAAFWLYSDYHSSPRYRLRSVLHLNSLPSSVKNIWMGSDVWTDVLYEFSFEIAPNDFPKLLTGRPFAGSGEVDPNPMVTKSAFMSPQVSFEVSSSYGWSFGGDKKGRGSESCEIDTNKERTRVFVKYSAD